MKNFNKNDVVSVPLLLGQVANTYLMHSIDEDKQIALVYHTRFPTLLLEVPLSTLQPMPGVSKGVEEQSLDYCRRNTEFLSYEEQQDLLSLEITIVVCRKFSKTMKKSLADMVGKIASYKLNDDLESAITLIKENVEQLDSFNLMWYNNFNKLFEGKQPVTSRKQKDSIFNMAGFVMTRLTYVEPILRSMDDINNKSSEEKRP